jgi:hypothetical protein
LRAEAHRCANTRNPEMHLETGLALKMMKHRDFSMRVVRRKACRQAASELLIIKIQENMGA